MKVSLQGLSNNICVNQKMKMRHSPTSIKGSLRILQDRQFTVITFKRNDKRVAYSLKFLLWLISICNCIFYYFKEMSEWCLQLQITSSVTRFLLQLYLFSENRK